MAEKAKASNNGRARSETPSERELSSLILLERGISHHVRQYGRPYQRHVPLEGALKHVREERLILEAAINGDEEAKSARRRKPTGQADAVGS